MHPNLHTSSCLLHFHLSLLPLTLSTSQPSHFALCHMKVLQVTSQHHMLHVADILSGAIIYAITVELLVHIDNQLWSRVAGCSNCTAKKTLLL